MKRNLFVLLSAIIFATGMKTVEAECSVTENNRLNSMAVGVRSDYEEVIRDKDPNSYDLPDGSDADTPKDLKEVLLQVNVYNITEDLYIIVHNSITDTTKKYTYEDSKDGVISFEWDNIYQIVNYTITVYSSDKTNCPNTKLHTLYVTTPRYNENSVLSACSGAEDFYLCYKYISVEMPDESEFIRLVDEYKKGHINESGEEIKEPEKNEKKSRVLPIAIGIGALGVIGVTAIVVVVRRNGRNEK